MPMCLQLLYFLAIASNVVAWENRVKDKDVREGEIVLQQVSMNDTDFWSVSQDLNINQRPTID